MGHQSWLLFKSMSQKTLSASIEESCLLLSRPLKSAALKKAREIADVSQDLDDEILNSNLVTEDLSWLPDVLGKLYFNENQISFYPIPQSSLDIDFGIIHHRAGDSEYIEVHPIELWNGDELTFKKDQNHFNVIIERAELDLGEVLAERSIKDFPRFADKIFNSKSGLKQLFEHSQTLGKSSDLDQTLHAASRMVFDLLPRCTHVAIALKENESKRFPVVYAHNRSGNDVEIPVSHTLIKKVIEKQSALLLMDASQEIGSALSVLAAGLVSTMVVPLWVGAKICGVLQVDNRDQPSAFSATDLELITVAANSISFAIENARLIRKLKVAEENLKGGLKYMQTQDRQEASGLIGESAVMTTIVQNIERVKDLKVPVFINGETGTGKELIARALHYQSNRRNQLFVAQNCGALPESLLESELFGHTKGSFTGADRNKKGLFELADGGSIFLDEVGEMPQSLQSKLLRVLQEGEIWPLGASGPKKVNVRVISATHRNLNEMVSEGSFRQDLFYRLHVYPIVLPPLRDRGKDVVLIAKHFLDKYAHEFGRAVSGFSESTMRCLLSYDWPGNVRELQNEIQRALISRFEGDLILMEDLSPHISGVSHKPDVMKDTLSIQGTLKEMMAYLEKQLLERALNEHDRNKTNTAKALGITREGLHKKLTRFSM